MLVSSFFDRLFRITRTFIVRQQCTIELWLSTLDLTVFYQNKYGNQLIEHRPATVTVVTRARIERN